VSRVAAAAILACAATAAAVVLNLVLLGRTSGGTEKVGRLQPRASIPATPAPADTVRPHTPPGSRAESGNDD
jgi:hypothetical protein